ncbi:MAG: hypothetical protein M3Z19_04870, partial [Chloroflexota bacterium]|nr:hypothetical protein [Chloroflexota bacterium]
MSDDARSTLGLQASPAMAAALRQRLGTFLAPLLIALDAHLDRRLVRTFAASIEAIVRWRNRAHGLLLSELGGYLLTPDHAPAGTKRLANLLRSPKWSAALIARFLWQQADTHLTALEAAGEEALAVWDESVREKPERLALEGLCAVRSSKAHRLTRIKPGFFHPPTRPIFVPGMQWIGVLVLGMSGPPTVAAMRWWTSRGERAGDKRAEEGTLFARCVAAWGRQVAHVWDRGFAGRAWLGQALAARVRFVLRWPGRYKLLTAMGEERPAWQVARGKRKYGAGSCATGATGQENGAGMPRPRSTASAPPSAASGRNIALRRTLKLRDDSCMFRFAGGVYCPCCHERGGVVLITASLWPTEEVACMVANIPGE